MAPSLSGEAGKKLNHAAALGAGTALFICRSRILLRSTRANFQVFSERAGDSRQVRGVSKAKTTNTRLDFSVPRRRAIAPDSRQGSQRRSLRARNDCGGTQISLRHLWLGY